MLRRYTSFAVSLLLLSACSTLERAPLLGGSTTPTPADADSDAAAATAAQMPSEFHTPVDMPKVRSGNQALFDRGLKLMRDANHQAAEVLFLEITESQPELAGPWVNLGKIYELQEQPEDARRAYETAIKANPGNCDALTQLGVLSRRHGQFREAESLYRRCVAAQPFYAPVHLNLGILYELYMGRLDEALAAYNEYQTLVPEPDSKVAGWVLDLERRVAAIAQR